MTTPIEVIDTAVKIGLGALISGLATYWVTRAKSKHDISKLLLEDKTKILREIAENLEESTAFLNDFRIANCELESGHSSELWELRNWGIGELGNWGRATATY